jgi:hypothetical protein
MKLEQIKGTKIYYIHLELPSNKPITYSYHFEYENSKNEAFIARMGKDEYISRTEYDLREIENVIFDTPHKIGHYKYDNSGNKL